ncbi:MAG TPA: hypothetical protein PKE12_02130 [Kiritimatiellia bacterium]|nr:hypothetical protein [Kiritimatiellia bacterium]
MRSDRPHFRPLIQPQSSGASNGTGFEVTLRWVYRAAGHEPALHPFELSLIIHRSSYDRASNELAFAPWVPAHYAEFILRGPLAEIRLLAARLRALGTQCGFTPLQEVENIVSMVRSLRYWSDPGHPHAVDQPKYPVQTLVDGGGDCEDFAILAAALLWTLGHPVALIYLETEFTAHMALGCHVAGLDCSCTVAGPDGREYAYIETVPTDVPLGVIPDEFLEGLLQAVAIPLELSSEEQGDEP